MGGLNPLLVIGCGYSGRAIRKLVPGAIGTSLPGDCREDEIPFRLDLTGDWSFLPESDRLLVTCKIDDEALAQRIRDEMLPRFRRSLFLSSAASLRCQEARLDESSGPAESPRGRAEAILSPVAPLLALGLITGPGREPEKWLRQGRVASRHKLVNFIPVEQLARIALRILDHPEDPRGWILCSDGRPRTWGDVAVELGLEPPPDQPPQRDSRAFKLDRLWRLLDGCGASGPGQ
ncbi:MAG: hypothetical protein RL095_1458 [Verrucomicrobiota bacterium]|jgi:hypothetical protein